LTAHQSEEKFVANLLVRGVDESVVKALKARAREQGQSAEAEHRAILAAALVDPRKRSFAEVLAPMPDVGVDADFERVNSQAVDPLYLIDSHTSPGH
jgi:plasmid stability protein